MLTLYNYPMSTCSQKVRLCLAEKNLEYTNKEINLAQNEHLKPEYLAINPNGVVPTLRHNNDIIHDSSVIMEYLDERFPDPALVPRGLVGRAHLRTWLRFIEEVPTVAIRYSTFNKFLLKNFQSMDSNEFEDRANQRPLRKQLYQQMGQDGFSDQIIEDSLDRLRQTADRMEQVLEAGPWVMGEQLTIADLALAPTFDRMQDLGLTQVWAAYPLVNSWFKHISSRPGYAAAFYHGSRFSDA